ncbi:MAG TPA: formylglycine-generating enzyme family protein [Myxococcota bacterium]|mgnify:FL=1|nr:formylglycine-generating enzyme family protein [Myxococcota bacterium]
MRCTIAASLAGFLVMLIIAPMAFAEGDCPGTKVKYQGKCVYPDSVPVETPPKKKAPPARPVDPLNPAGIDWVRVEGGTFLMGSDRGDSDERPRHRVTIRTFEMARTEVTVEQYRRCVEAGACTEPVTGDACNWGQAGRDRHPVNCVDWDQAQAFARWAGGRLPSEAEWEYAARSGGQEREYPWGNETATCERAVMWDGSGVGCDVRKGTWPVCSRPGGNTEQGLCDMAGNVWEWVQDWYQDSYQGAPTDGRAWEDLSRTPVDRGGSWDSDSLRLRASNRNRDLPGIFLDSLGFRLSRSVP